MTAAVVDLRARRVRHRNATGRENCRTCGNGALILVETEPRPVLRLVPREGDRPPIVAPTGSTYAAELYGPCPFCERGFRVEFGVGSRHDGTEYTNPDGGPWGADGFWQGREVPAEAV